MTDLSLFSATLVCSPVDVLTPTMSGLTPSLDTGLDTGNAIARLEAYARDSSQAAARMAGGAALRLAGRRPSAAELDAVIVDALHGLHAAFLDALGQQRLALAVAVDLWLGPDGDRRPVIHATPAAVGVSPQTRAGIARAVDTDARFHHALAAADAQARVTAVARIATAAAAAARTAPEDAGALWAWLADRVERLTDARFVVRIRPGDASAVLSDAAGRPLAVWSAGPPCLAAAE